MKCRKFSNSNGYNIRLTSSPRYQSVQDADGIVLSVFARTGREDAVYPNLSLERETLKKAGFTAHCTSCHIGFSPGQLTRRSGDTGSFTRANRIDDGLGLRLRAP